jgi:peroxiredoxin
MKRVSWFRLLSGVLIVGILALNVVLLGQNQRMKDHLDTLLANKTFHAGDTFPSFAGVDLDGRLVAVDPEQSQKRTLVLLLSTGCPACLASLDHWRTLAAGLDPAQWDVLWLSRDPWEMTRAFAVDKGISGRMLSEFSCRNYARLSLKLVPKTIVLGPGGKVEGAWEGQLDAQHWAEAEAVLAAASPAPATTQVAAR